MASHRARNHLLGVMATVLLALVAAVVPAGAVRAALPPNQSIIFYRPGQVSLGTFTDGFFVQKRVLSGPEWTGWTHIVVSRDTLLLYARPSGRVRTGRFQNGVYTPTATRTIAAGYDAVAASCDTALFYRSTGRAHTYTLTRGRLGATATPTAVPAGARAPAAASCDTVLLQGPAEADHPTQAHVVGLLKRGRFTPGTSFREEPLGRLTMTRTSYVFYRPNILFWGTARGGALGRFVLGSAGTWTHLAGTADSVLFYNSPTGAAAQWVLENGAATVPSPQQDGFSPGWTMIAGGK